MALMRKFFVEPNRIKSNEMLLIYLFFGYAIVKHYSIVRELVLDAGTFKPK